ncbi:MAG: hypothetical protein SD837_05555 [Candidatus Electrothrix scaldis]|nr:MAG: hypothetical protein SD837_05555 [Candidatus Electrothrix sp. GW3-3]
MAELIDSLFKTQGKRKRIVPLQADADSLQGDTAKYIHENRTFEYVTLEEAAEKTELNIKYLLRGALTDRYLLYHFYADWWPVPVMALNDLYNGNKEVSSKIWRLSEGKWLPTHIGFIEPLDAKWGKESEAVEKVSLTIASLHIREDDLKKIINTNELVKYGQFYKSDELELAIACSRELYPTKPPEASTDGEKKTNAQTENKRINEWLQRNRVDVKRKCDRIRVMVNPYTD